MEFYFRNLYHIFLKGKSKSILIVHRTFVTRIKVYKRIDVRNVFIFVQQVY